MSVQDSSAKLRKALEATILSKIPIQTHWGIVKSVDWDKKLMVADDINGEVPFYNVILGLGNRYLKPVVGSKCLLGIINNKAASTYLIDAEKVEEIVLKGEGECTAYMNYYNFNLELQNLNIDAVQTTFNGGDNGGLPISQNVIDRLNLVEQDINDLKDAIINWVPVSQDGGLSLQTKLTTPPPTGTGWALQSLEESKLSDIENPDVKH